MFKPYNKAEITFDFLNEIGKSGRNSRTFISKDHQLDAEIVIKQIPKAKLASAQNFLTSQKRYMRARIRTSCRFITLAMIRTTFIWLCRITAKAPLHG
jgi:hypothetical protein